MPQLHVHISGRVQGVGFRFATKIKADSLGLTGWVRNLYDKRVEAVFEGEDPALSEMLLWCKQGPTLAKVQNVEAVLSQAPKQYDDFQLIASTPG